MDQIKRSFFLKKLACIKKVERFVHILRNHGDRIPLADFPLFRGIGVMGIVIVTVVYKQGDVDTKKKIQELVFPNGILWDRIKRNYRTENRNKFLTYLTDFQ